MQAQVKPPPLQSIPPPQGSSLAAVKGDPPKLQGKAGAGAAEGGAEGGQGLKAGVGLRRIVPWQLPFRGWAMMGLCRSVVHDFFHA